jgi:organic hydroperoxide reductase OsmC/OhrA
MEHEYTVRLSLDGGFSFTVDFDDPALPTLRTDEPRPLGGGDGPNPIKLLAASIANCLAASFLFCTRRAHIEVDDMRATARVRVDRNAGGRLRITSVDVDLDPRFRDPSARVDRCLGLFEDFCTVTASVRDGIDVTTRLAGIPIVAGAVQPSQPAAPVPAGI